MTRRFLMMLAVSLAMSGGLSALEDPGKTKIGRITVMVVFATDGDPAAAGERGEALDEDLAKRLRREERLRFGHYRLLGEDTQPLLRSYDSWAQPLEPSDEVMVRLEANGVPTATETRLDLELWLGRKKTVKMDARLQGGRPLFVLGPEWRGGRLIVVVALARERKAGS